MGPDPVLDLIPRGFSYRDVTILFYAQITAYRLFTLFLVTCTGPPHKLLIYDNPASRIRDHLFESFGCRDSDVDRHAIEPLG